ncbi:hypothetical protein DPMN_166844 [Dreissena polymorpha]|uniref:Uncharacterized protein n=1 Tax=Dreissena polymorpha TaxID=45954 RepID=A0A9D4F281_DREPO|nr:hypothetical protein DPMN_166844 [Dreissena polymorpha]
MQECVMFNIVLLKLTTKGGPAPTYKREQFTTRQCGSGLRSVDENTFNFPRNRTKNADRSIAVIGQKWWNTLPK